MSENEHGKPFGSLPEGLHRRRPGLARWTRMLAAIACMLGGVVLLTRGVSESDELWLWVGALLVALGVVGVVLAAWMHRRRL